MRHRALVAATSVLFLALTSAPVRAADPVVVIGGPPPGWDVVHQDCVDPAGGAASGSASPQLGPGVNGTSDGSVRLIAGDGDIHGFSEAFSPFSDLVDLGAHVYEESGSTIAIRIEVSTADGVRVLVLAPVLADGVWDSITPVFSSTPWKVYGESVNATYPDTTLEDFQLAHPDAPFEIGVVSWGCSAESTGYVDRLRFQFGATEHSFDFEPLPTSVTIARDKDVLDLGGQVTLTGLATQAGNPLAGVPLTLFADPAWGVTETSSAPLTDGEGLTSYTHMPTYNTTYRWRYAGGGEYAPDWSPTRTVLVRSDVTASLIDETVRTGERIKVTGKVKPSWNNLLVTLWRKTSSGRVKLGTTRTTSTSTYRVTSGVIGTTGSATWKVYVTVPATEHNTAGQSARLPVEIN